MTALLRLDAPGRSHALDGIRAICALGVLLHHHIPDIGGLAGTFLPRAFEQGFLALGPFFVLSGYLITDRYFAIGRTGLKAYLFRRIARIFPLLILVTTGAFAVHWYNGTIPDDLILPLYFANITTLKGWFDDLKFTGIVQTWSLTPEVAFYALAPVFFIAMRRMGGRILFLVPVLLLAIGLLLVLLCADRSPWGLLGSEQFLYANTYFGRATEFTVGMAIAWIIKRRSSFIGRFAYTLWGAVFTVSGILAMILERWNYDDPGGVLIANFLWPILGLGPLLMGLLTEHTWLRTALCMPLLGILGRSSYAFYLIHLGFIFTALIMLTGSFLFTVFVLQVVAWLLHRFFEEPIAAWARLRWPLRGSGL